MSTDGRLEVAARSRPSPPQHDRSTGYRQQHIEKIFDEEGIQGEIGAYESPVLDGSDWKATMLIDCPEPNERKREPARLVGIEDRLFAEVEGPPRIRAVDHTHCPARVLIPKATLASLTGDLR